jgi:hypothetical protein
MKGAALPFAQREWPGRLFAAGGAMLALGGALGLSGPFGTYEEFGGAARLAYWILAVMGVWGLIELLAFAAARLMPERARPRPALALTLLVALAAWPGTAWLVLLERGLLARPVDADWLATWLEILVLGTGLTLTAHGLRLGPAAWLPARGDGHGADTRPPAERPHLLGRLPGPARTGRLLALSADGHYVRVITDRGEGQLLMRLTDAIAETGDEPGLQVHRSHWVARHAVIERRSDGERWWLVLENGRAVPVSRRRRKTVAAWLGH